MRIRPARIGDGLAANALYRELVGPDVQVADGPLGAKRWAALVTHAGTTVFVCEHPENGVVGMVTLHILPNVSFSGQSYALIENMIVNKAARGNGHGRALMEAALREAWRSDCHHVLLLTEHALEASAFYEKLGFDGSQRLGMIMMRPEMV